MMPYLRRLTSADAAGDGTRHARVVEENALSVVDVTLAAAQDETAAHEMALAVVPHQFPPLGAPRPRAAALRLAAAVRRPASVCLPPPKVPLHRNTACTRVSLSRLVRALGPKPTCQIDEGISHAAALQQRVRSMQLGVRFLYDARPEHVGVAT
jgi:hypothetical protein